MRRSTATITSPTTARLPTRSRRSCATRIRRSSSFPGSGCSGLQGQAGSAHHDRVLRQRHSRDGWRERARGRDDRRHAAAGEAAGARAGTSPASITMWRCRGSKRSVSNTGRSKRPSCSACRPSGSSAARSRSSSAAASGIGRDVAVQLAKRGGARRGRRPEPGGARRRRPAKRPTASSAEMVLAVAAEPRPSRETIRAAIARRRPDLRRPRHRDQHGGDLSDAGAGHAAGRGLEPGDGDQRQQQSRAGAGGERDLQGRRACPQPIVLTSSANAVVPKRAVSRTTSARPRSTT